MKIILAAALLLSSSAFAAHGDAIEYTGILHNNHRESRATLEANNGRLYFLNYGDYSMYDIAEPYDRERVVVRGTLEHSEYGRPIIKVDSITFRPRRNAVTYYPGGRERKTVERYTSYRYADEEPYDTSFGSRNDESHFDRYTSGYDSKFVE
jgi:hypothetical protein